MKAEEMSQAKLYALIGLALLLLAGINYFFITTFLSGELIWFTSGFLLATGFLGVVQALLAHIFFKNVKLGWQQHFWAAITAGLLGTYNFLLPIITSLAGLPSTTFIVSLTTSISSTLMIGFLLSFLYFNHEKLVKGK